MEGQKKVDAIVAGRSQPCVNCHSQMLAAEICIPMVCIVMVICSIFMCAFGSTHAPLCPCYEGARDANAPMHPGCIYQRVRKVETSDPKGCAPDLIPIPFPKTPS